MSVTNCDKLAAKKTYLSIFRSADEFKVRNTSNSFLKHAIRKMLYKNNLVLQEIADIERALFGTEKGHSTVHHSVFVVINNESIRNYYMQVETLFTRFRREALSRLQNPKSQ